MPLSLILFDLDGTLVDSSTDIALAINHAVLPFGLAPVTVTETRGLIGEGTSRLVEKLIERGRPGIPVGKAMEADGGEIHEAILSRFMEHYTAHALDNTRLYPGVKETLDHLDDYPMAVISNKREFLSRMVLEGLGIIGHFSMVLGSDTVAEKKPSPVPVFHVLRALRVAPENAMIVGDSHYDIMAGRAAGVITTAVTYGYRPLEDLRGADYVIDAFAALPGIVRGIP